MTPGAWDEESQTFHLTYDQVVNLCANVWNEGYCTQRDKHGQELAHVHNPYIQKHKKREAV